MGAYKVKQVKAKALFPIIEELLEIRRCIRITVTGISMYPFLREYIDSVELSYTDFEGICRGDIVVASRDSNCYVMHRVTRKEKNCFYMVGDFQQQIEGPLRPDQLVGVITAVYRKNRRIDCSNEWWKLFSWLWILLLPYRGIFISMYLKIKDIKTKFIKED